MTTAVAGGTQAMPLEYLHEVLGQLLEYRQSGDREQFEDVLRTMGVVDPESYWDALDPVSGASWQDARDNTQLSGSLGLCIDTREMPNLPRNMLLYRVVERAFPDLIGIHLVPGPHVGGKEWRDRPDARKFHFTRLPAPADGNRRERGSPMSVLDLVQGRKPAQFDALVMRAAQPLREVMGDELGQALAKFVVDFQLEMPTTPMAMCLAQAFERAAAGEPVTVYGAYCPDYPTEDTGNPGRPKKYVFGGLGTGVGLVASQFLRIGPAFSQFLTEQGIEHRIVLGIGDFEADIQANLDGAGVDRAEFIRRCRLSMEAFARAWPADVEAQHEMCGERCGDRLRTYAAQAEQRLLAHDYGHMHHAVEDVDACMRQLPQDFRTFYEAWATKNTGGDRVKLSDTEVWRKICAQAGEYAALARVAEEDFGGVVFHLAGDRPTMNVFNSLDQPAATLCARRCY